jgi:hypothetical protein
MNRQQKIKFIKDLIEGRATLKKPLAPKVILVHTWEKQPDIYYTEDDQVLTEADMKAIEQAEHPRPVLWIKVVDISQASFRLPSGSDTISV